MNYYVKLCQTTYFGINYLILFFLLNFILACNKVDLNWNLKRTGNNDSKQNIKNTTLYIIDCESLIGINYFSNVSSTSIGWHIGEGYVGNGFLTNNSKGGYVEFNKIINENIVVSFWTKSMNPGFSNRFPEVFVNGNMINSSLIEGKEDYSKWMKIQTAQLPKGNCNIKISFSNTSTFYNLYIDEITLIKKLTKI